jgi:hypothetical protein
MTDKHVLNSQLPQLSSQALAQCCGVHGPPKWRIFGGTCSGSFGLGSHALDREAVRYCKTTQPKTATLFAALLAGRCTGFHAVADGPKTVQRKKKLEIQELLQNILRSHR